MSDEERDRDSGGGGGAWFDDGRRTIEVDYPAEFVEELRLGLAQISADLGGFKAGLAGNSIAQRRAKFFGLCEELENLRDRIDDAVGLSRRHARALTIEIAKRDAAETVPLEVATAPVPRGGGPSELVSIGVLSASGVVAVAAIGWVVKMLLMTR